jgi:hypothetical protein
MKKYWTQMNIISFQASSNTTIENLVIPRSRQPFFGPTRSSMASNRRFLTREKKNNDDWSLERSRQQQTTDKT